MKNTNIAQQVKELRKKLGLSQDQLADQTQLSLRTIQRVENNEVEPRGETLNRLAKALNTSIHEFNLVEKDDKTYLLLINLSALSFLLFPYLGIIIPTLLWILKREKIMHLNDTGKKLINFQITWCILITLVYLWLFGIFTFPVEISMRIGRPELGVLVIYLLYALNIIAILVNMIRSAKAKDVIYRPAVPFFR